MVDVGFIFSSMPLLPLVWHSCLHSYSFCALYVFPLPRTVCLSYCPSAPAHTYLLPPLLSCPLDVYLALVNIGLIDHLHCIMSWVNIVCTGYPVPSIPYQEYSTTRSCKMQEFYMTVVFLKHHSFTIFGWEQKYTVQHDLIWILWYSTTIVYVLLMKDLSPSYVKMNAYWNWRSFTFQLMLLLIM